VKNLPPAVAQETEYCNGCPLVGQSYVPGEGYSNCPCLVVGGAPGPVEEKKLTPFLGPAGTLVREVLKGFGIEERVYLTNVLKRRPVAADNSNRKPTRQECFKCGSHLVTEVVRHQPKVVLALGQIPLEFFLGRKLRVSQVHGLPIPVTRFQNDMILIPLYDPAFVLRNGGLTSEAGAQFLADVEEAIQAMARKGV
jgi:uracil-DNA glycosylase family 4